MRIPASPLNADFQRDLRNVEPSDGPVEEPRHAHWWDADKSPCPYCNVERVRAGYDRLMHAVRALDPSVDSTEEAETAIRRAAHPAPKVKRPEEPFIIEGSDPATDSEHGRGPRYPGEPIPSDGPVEEPRTKAGREMMAALPLHEWHPMNTEFVRDHIRAIEAEAAHPATEPHRDYAGRTCTTGLLHAHPATEPKYGWHEGRAMHAGKREDCAERAAHPATVTLTGDDAIRAGVRMDAGAHPATEGLDVERLGEVLESFRLRDSEYFAPLVAGSRLQTSQEWAAEIAARLSSPEGQK